MVFFLPLELEKYIFSFLSLTLKEFKTLLHDLSESYQSRFTPNYILHPVDYQALHDLWYEALHVMTKKDSGFYPLKQPTHWYDTNQYTHVQIGVHFACVHVCQSNESQQYFFFPLTRRTVFWNYEPDRIARRHNLFRIR
jgi:hypothetical protein